MDHLARLIFVALLALGFTSQASAYGGRAPTLESPWKCVDPTDSAHVVNGPSASAACGAMFSSKNTTYIEGLYRITVSYSLSGCTTNEFATRCDATKVENIVFAISGQGAGSSSSTVTAIAQQLPPAKTCLSGGTLQTGGVAEMCECPLGKKPNAAGTQCEPYTCPAKGAYSVVTQPDMEVANVGPQCKDGCTVNPSSVKGAPDGKLWATWPYVSTGETCGGKDDANNVATGEDKISDPPVPCGANMCPGSVNGAAVCVACKDTTIKGPSSSASAPDGQTPQIPGAPPGAVSEEKSTNCTQSSCTTTTIYRDGAGNIVGQKSEEKGQESFCKDNPDASICKKGSWGGACGAFTCDGDAVQCALALRVHKSACEWEQVDQSLVDLGNGAMGGQARPDGHPFASPDQQSLAFSSVIDQSNRLGGGCPVDASVSVGGQTYVIPWSQHCDKFQLIGNLMVGLCMLVAAFIVFRS